MSKIIYSGTQSTIDGTPFIPLGVYGVSLGDIPKAAEVGFNLIQDYSHAGADNEKIQTYLDAAQANGVKVFLSMGGAYLTPTLAESIKEKVLRFKNHPALWAWYLADEPSKKTVDHASLFELYSWIKTNDPDHPVISSTWAIKDFTDCADIDMRQMYSGAPWSMRILAKNYLTGMKRMGLDHVTILNTHDNNFGHISADRESLSATQFFRGLKQPSAAWDKAYKRYLTIKANLARPPFRPQAGYPDSPQRIRGSFYEAVINGSNGAFWWIWGDGERYDFGNARYTIFHKPYLKDAIISLLAEAKQYQANLLNPQVNSSLTKLGAISTWQRTQDGVTTVIAVNGSRLTRKRQAIPAPAGFYTTVGGVAPVSSNGTLFADFTPNEAQVWISQ